MNIEKIGIERELHVSKYKMIAYPEMLLAFEDWLCANARSVTRTDDPICLITVLRWEEQHSNRAPENIVTALAMSA